MVKKFCRYSFLVVCVAAILSLTDSFFISHVSVFASNRTSDEVARGLAAGELDGAALLFLFLTSLFLIGAFIWIGAQLWHSFVAISSEDGVQELRGGLIFHIAEAHFVQRFAVPLLVILSLLNPLIFFSQALVLAGGRIDYAFPFLDDVWSSRFGIYRLIGELLLLVALGVTLVARHYLKHNLEEKKRHWLYDSSSWLLLLLALGLLVTLIMTGPALDVSAQKLPVAMLADFVVLLAVSFWLGGLFYLYLLSLNALPSLDVTKRIVALEAIFQRYRWVVVIGGIAVLFGSVISASVYLMHGEQILSTLYGRVLIATLLLLLLVFVISICLSWLPIARVDQQKSNEEQLEERQPQVHRVNILLRWNVVFACLSIIGLTIITNLAGSLPLLAAAQSSQTTTIKPFVQTIRTDDEQFLLQVEVSPNRFGLNTFTVRLLNDQDNLADTIQVTLYTNMVDMDMGTQPIQLAYDGANQWSGEGVFSMGGQWQLQLRLRTPDDVVHVATVDVMVPF